MAGHRLVQFNLHERQHFQRYVENGGFVFVDDCNHDIDGMFERNGIDAFIHSYIKEKEVSYLASGSKNTIDKINLGENQEVIIWGVVTYVIHKLQ